VSRVVLVTGGTRGIGRGIADAFAALGDVVVVCGRNDPGDQPHTFLAADVRDHLAVDRLIEEVVARFGRLDVLVNNAGGSPVAEAATASPRFSEKIIALNLIAPLHCAQRANRQMQQQVQGGVILNVCSIAGQRPAPTVAAYGAAKAGLLSLTGSLAQEFAPKVRVNAVTPGLIDTSEAGEHYRDLAAVTATVPLGRLGRPRDVAAACVWLASEEAAWVSGTNLVVHGGGERPPFLTAQEQA
jgi:NAD(P)-dependent dehydrogenase (short-subunit alcohol dehydrogenase family)